LKKARQTYKKKVENYVELVEKSGLTNLDRLKLISLITIEEHNREVIEKIYAQKIQSPKHFEWLQQLRFKRGNDENEQLYI
jgi:dynein heavy chain, axonemal